MTTKPTKAQRREAAEKHCMEQLHTTLQCMHLPVKLTRYDASITTVGEAFASVITLMRCHLQEFRQELARIEAKPDELNEGLEEFARAASDLIRISMHRWTEAELEAQHSSKLTKVRDLMLDFLKAKQEVQVISFEGGLNADVVADGMDAVDYVEHLINAKKRTDLTTTARWELDSLRVLDLPTLKRVKLVMIGRRADGQKIVVYRKGSQGDVLVGEAAIAHVANLIEELQTEAGDSQWGNKIPVKQEDML